MHRGGRRCGETKSVGRRGGDNGRKKNKRGEVSKAQSRGRSRCCGRRTLGYDDRGLHDRLEDGLHPAAARELEGVREVSGIAHKRCAPVPVNGWCGGCRKRRFPTPCYVQHKHALT